MIPDPDSKDPRTTPDSRELEELLARLIDRHAVEGDASLEAMCAEHPEHAFRLRSRLADLERLGLLEPAAGEDLPDRIGPYEVVKRIGSGGMSLVFLVRDPRVGREVALKALQGWGAQGRSRARFERETRAVARLAHPCIVPIHDVGEENGRPYFTMELVHGASLAHVLQGLREAGQDFEALEAELVRDLVVSAADQLPKGTDLEPRSGSRPGSPRGYIELVCSVVLDVADALGYAHARGIVHRDVKPSNILLRVDGRAQLCDFGLAHLEEEPALTMTGDFTGTPHYVAPEQLGPGRPVVDARTDVYGLGVTLYEMLTLRRPFEGGGGTAGILHRIQTHEAPHPHSVQSGIPRDLETICMKAMDRDRGRRYGSMADLAADLRRFLEFRPVEARPVGALTRYRRRARRNPAWALAWALAVLMALAIPGGLLWSGARVRVQRDVAVTSAIEAARQAELSARVTSYLLELIRPAGQERVEPEVRALFQRRLEELAPGTEADAQVRAALLETSGRVVENLGLPAEAIPYYDRAYLLLRGELGESDPRVARVLLRLASCHVADGNPGTARDIATRALVGLREGPEGHAELEVELQLVLAEACLALEDAGQASLALASAFDLLTAVATTDPRDAIRFRARFHEARSRLAGSLGDRAQARAELEHALTQRGLQWVPEPDAWLATAERWFEVAGPDAWGPQRATLERLRSQQASVQALEHEALPPPPVDWKDPSAQPFGEDFQRGVAALQAGQGPLAAEAFRSCVELRPQHAVSRYNLACALALCGEEALALDALEDAVVRGFGATRLHIEVARKDSDLADLRATKRGQRLLERMEHTNARTRGRVPLVVAPDTEGPRPLWVVLHAEGESPDRVAAGAWGELAAEHGAILLAPPAAAAVAEDPARGLRWLERMEDFEREGPRHEALVLDAVSGALDAHAIQRGEVLLVGEGQGALLAWDLALRFPGLFPHLILVDGPPDPKTSPERARLAARVGQRIDFVLGPMAGERFERPGASREEVLASCLEWARGLGLVARGGDPDDLASLLR